MPATIARPRVEINGDLRFSVELPGRRAVQGTVRGSGSRIEVRLSDNAIFAGARDAAHLRGLAAMLASRGLTLVVLADDVVLLELGATESPWWQRPITRSRHLRVASVRGALTGAAGRIRRAGEDAVLPGSRLLPPPTLLPVAPTFVRRRRPVTTTHDPRRGGNPRLVLAASSGPGAEHSVTFPLRRDTTSIGSDPASDIRLDGLDGVHAVVEHDAHDELVVRDRSDDHSTLVNGAPAGDGVVLRTGSRLTVGPWSLVYARAEYADHGRPYGGRVGGEAGHQRSQPDPRRVRPSTEPEGLR